MLAEHRLGLAADRAVTPARVAISAEGLDARIHWRCRMVCRKQRPGQVYHLLPWQLAPKLAAEAVSAAAAAVAVMPAVAAAKGHPAASESARSPSWIAPLRSPRPP